MDRIALVTGGASGWGLATARAFAEAGMTVVIGDLSADSVASSASSLPNGGHHGVAFDVSDEAAVAHAFSSIEAEVGPIAVLAHFAGISGHPVNGFARSIAGLELADWDRVMAVNARGAFLCIREMIRLRTRRPVPLGRIIAVSSMAAQNGGLNSGPGYVASKGAVMSFVKVAAREAAPLGMTVNTIAPGAIDTPMLRSVMPPEKDEAYCVNVPVGRVGTPEEIAATAAFLASPAASYITGACIDVNGGMRMQ